MRRKGSAGVGLEIVRLAPKGRMKMKTMSPVTSTLLTTLTGALLVGLASAVLFALALAPQGGIPFDIAQVAMMFVLGAIFGTIAGGVAGASETADAPAPVPEPARVLAATVRA